MIVFICKMAEYVKDLYAKYQKGNISSLRLFK